jgi:class 3 adenylate cyclase/TolB-like protein/Tfp pilus assembly protein PilF
MPDDQKRQLAAIMFADMVGYTALMQEDEDFTRLHRDRQREVLSELVPHHGGEILQNYGDGTLSIFTSAVEAVKCAVAFQLELRNEPTVQMRVGIHTGDVVQDANGVYGHGVNVASRIEGLASAGGIMISGKVYDEIKNHPSLAAVSLGRVTLKNVEYPVALFGISNDDMVLPSESEVQAKAAGAPATNWLGETVEEGGGESRGAGEAFLRRVRDRALIQWALVYLLGAWAVIQAFGFVADQLHWPPYVENGVSVLAFVGFFIAMVVAWYHGERGRQAVRPREVIIISVLLVLGVASLSLIHSEEERGIPNSPARPAPTVDDRPSIAVLPFDNFSPDPDDAYFPNGVQEDITTALSKIRSLRVPARSSVVQFRDERPGSREIASVLGVDYLLEGSTTVVGGMARVTVQLIDGRTDQHIWAENYDHEFSIEQLISVRTAVAKEVAARLRAIITPQEEARIATPPTDSPEALKLYQRARYRWNERTEPGVQESLWLFQEAIDEDPSFAEAYAGLADAYLVLANRGWMDHREGHRRGIAAAERALELDGSNAGANASLGALHLWSTRDWAVSESYFLRALELDSEYAYAHYWYSALLSALGRHQEAIRQAREALSVDPLSPQIASGLPRSLFLSRDFDGSIAEVTRAIGIHREYGPLHGQLCRSHILKSEFDDAEVACIREKELSGASGSLSLALVYAFQGDEEAALGEVGRLGLAEDGGVPQPIIMAMVYGGLGDLDAAFAQIDLAFDGEYPYLEYLSSNPFLDPLRADPRFAEQLRRIGL